MNKRIIFLLLMAMTYFNFVAFSADVPPDKISIETMFQEKFLSQLAVPQFQWLENGKVLLLDTRPEPAKRTFELLDPANGKRSPLADPAAVLASLKKILGQDAPERLEWPAAFDAAGKRALYILAGDLFLVELASGAVQRLTQSAPEEESAAFSPDGQWVSFTRDNDIYAVESKSGIEKRLTTGASATLLNGPLSWVYWEEIYDHTDVPYRWAPDSSAIAFLQSDDAGVPVSTFVHFKPVTEGVVQQRYPKPGQANPKVRLGIVEMASAATTWIDCGDYEYLARFNWLPNSLSIAVQTLNRQQSHLKLLLADRKSGKSRLILEEKSAAWLNLHDSLYFFKDNDRFIWLSERDGYGHLYLYSLDGRLIRQLTKGEYRVLPPDRGPLSKFGGLAGVDEKKGLVYFTSNREALKERHLYRVNLEGNDMKRLSAGEGVHGIAFSPDMRYYLDSYSNASQPDELVLYNAAGTKRGVVTPSAKEVLAPLHLAKPGFDTFKTADGLDLPVMMIKPPHFEPTQKYPVLIYVYGGPTAQQVVDSWSSRRAFWYHRLGQEGYIMLVLEVRAGLGKNRDIETSVYKEAYGMQNVKDILDGVKWLKEKPYIDPDRIGLWGGSGGGCTTIYTMTHTDVFKAGVSLFPVSDWYYYDSIYTERFLNTPQENPEGYKATSAVLTAPHLKGRLFIAHGTYDDNVHPQHTWAFINELIANNIQFELMIYPWRKHGISDYRARVHLYTLMLDFWKKNL